MTPLGSDTFISLLNYSPDELNVGDLIDYRLAAVDVSENKNGTYLPETGFYRVDVTDGMYFYSTPGDSIHQIKLSALGTKDTISISEDITIQDLNVYLESDHLRFSDLQVRLYAPDGTEFMLIDQDWKGSQNENAGSPRIVIDADAYFSFGNALLIDTNIAVGTFAPVSTDLTQLNGTSTLGDWRLRITDLEINSFTGHLTEWGLIVKGEVSTGVEDENDVLVNKYQLYQNYPNPFNPSTRIKYQVSSIEKVSLVVYDMLGREITTLVNEVKSPGTYEVEFDGSKLSSGIYFVRMVSLNFISTKKIMLLK